MARFNNQIALVTGGSTGIGLATARQLIAEGAKVYITGRTEKSLVEAAATLGPKAVPVVADVSRVADLEALARRIGDAGEKLDLLVANAGIAEYNALGASTEAEFDKTFGINVKGLFFTVQTLLPHLKNASAIVLTASVVAHKGMAGLSFYNASKAAVRSFARTFANDLKDRKIRVNAVSPGVTRTPIFENGLKLTSEQIDGFGQYVAENAPAGRVATPDEIAAAILFLGSAEASYVNGAELSVDGGFTQV